GPGDRVPTNPGAIAVALADKLDTLVGFWAIDEKPTGSKDPYGLRRAALGIVRIILENGIRLHITNYANDDLLAFILDRLKVYLRDQGMRHDHIDAVFASNSEKMGGDDLVDMTNRIKALAAFLATDEGQNLVAGYKRAANILKAEEKKGPLPSKAPDKGTLPQETALFSALEKAEPLIKSALASENYEEAMSALAELRAPIDAFFEHVTVNAENKNERENRLGLLMKIRKLAGTIADFSKLEG
ncbi:MAG TPA: glycine--tRNA ligase subunit beta, partial [Hellea balneolensis]|nr:glycine--tRNA ligase subunit beta [Hellea balneolensis]